MFRTFNLTLPALPAATTIWQLLVNAGYCDFLGNMLVSSVKNGAIIVDRCQQLTVTVNSGSVIIQDNSGSGASGETYTQGLSNTWRSTRNTISLKDRQLLGSAGSETVTIDMESI